MNKAVLNSELITTKAGNITVYNFDAETKEYLSTSTEYLAVGVGIPAYSLIRCTEYINRNAICRTVDLNSWEYVRNIAVKSSIAPKQENRKKSHLWVITLKIQPLSPR